MRRRRTLSGVETRHGKADRKRLRGTGWSAPTGRLPIILMSCLLWLLPGMLLEMGPVPFSFWNLF
ncbi:hypothetical protein AA0312_1591 [Acetobacter tropicalis NRIC 0312]|nr:hypothetical protein ATR1_069c0101 [Acetobacter tropicalis]GBR69881.1 hypothetical protein AA0312_1591 [Acetobacter tropicalis NRIC 0312]